MRLEMCPSLGVLRPLITCVPTYVFAAKRPQPDRTIRTRRDNQLLIFGILDMRDGLQVGAK